MTAFETKDASIPEMIRAMQGPAPLEYEMFESQDCPGEWHVDAVDLANEGLIYATIFTGSSARERAERYAAWVLGGAQAS
jgi:hypothetical protein